MARVLIRVNFKHYKQSHIDIGIFPDRKFVKNHSVSRSTLAFTELRNFRFTSINNATLWDIMISTVVVVVEIVVIIAAVAVLQS